MRSNFLHNNQTGSSTYTYVCSSAWTDDDNFSAHLAVQYQVPLLTYCEVGFYVCVTKQVESTY